MAESRPEPHLWVTVLAGGIGSRFWPASTPARPKPLLPLASSRPLIRDTVDRALAIVAPDRIAILAGEHLVEALRDVVPGHLHDRFWIEPQPKGTGPVLAWAAHRIFESDPAAVLVSLHADHRIEPVSELASSVKAAANLAVREDLLLSLAVQPDRPEPGYGYLCPGEPLELGKEGHAFRVERFVEKPDQATAEAYVARGFLWNTGIFVLPVSRFLEEIIRHSPEIGDHLPLLDQGKDTEFFDRVQAVSVDEAVFERSGRVGAVRASFEWDDVGGWQSLARSLDPDPAGNRTTGDVYAVDSRGSIVWAEDGPVVLFGMDDAVVVRSGGITLVTTRDASSGLKELLSRLPATLREGRAGTTGHPASADEKKK